MFCIIFGSVNFFIIIFNLAFDLHLKRCQCYERFPGRRYTMANTFSSIRYYRLERLICCIHDNKALWGKNNKQSINTDETEILPRARGFLPTYK